MATPDSSGDDRRDAVPFDPRHFEKRAAAGERLDAAATFDAIFRGRHWGADAPASGAGADRSQTQAIEAALPPLLADLGVRSLLDVPCGDFGWMQHVPMPGIDYTGVDLLPALVAAHQARYGAPGRRFLQRDVLRDALPTADLILCRDLLVHLSFADIARAVSTFRASASTYLLTTTFPDTQRNEDIVTGDWRPINLERPPFSWPPPERLIVEHCTESEGRFADKSLGLWRLDRLPSGAA